MRIKVDVTGQKFGKLIALNYSKTVKTQTFWLCKCECGNEKEINVNSLRRNLTTSCGCNYKTGNSRTHGLTKTPEYRIWADIKSRCSNKNDQKWNYYGGRGIKICDEWKDSFEIFLNDMGKRPSKQHSIDRIDNNLGYCKENCRWVTIKEQSVNKRTSKKVLNTLTNEVYLSIVEAANTNNINKSTLTYQLKNNKSYLKFL